MIQRESGHDQRGAGRPDLPTGIVTFLLTDVENSTRLWRTHADAADIMRRHAAIIAAATGETLPPRNRDRNSWHSCNAQFP
jgi:class 3 adenylate cyclase